MSERDTTYPLGCCENCGAGATVLLGGGAAPERTYCEVCGPVANVAGMLECEDLDASACYTLLHRIAVASGLMPSVEGDE